MSIWILVAFASVSIVNLVLAIRDYFERERLSRQFLLLAEQIKSVIALIKGEQK